MNNNSYIPAFTIVEAIVSMVVTAIILSIVFVIFSITSQRLADFQLQNEGIADLNRLTYGINKNIFDSEEMIYENNILTFINPVGKLIQYKADNNYLLMVKGDFIDTLNLSVQKLNVDTIINTSGRERYQRLKCALYCNDQHINLKFYKKIYTAALLKKRSKDEY